MKNRIILFALIALFALGGAAILSAQTANAPVPVHYVTSNPGGSCTHDSIVQLNYLTGQYWGCVGPGTSGVWTQVQPPTTGIPPVNSDPTGQPCTAGTIQQLIPSGKIYTCQAGFMAIVSGGIGVVNSSSSCSGTVTSCAVAVTGLNLTSIQPAIVECFASATGASIPITGITTVGLFPISSIVPAFSATANPYCTVNSSGGAGPPGATGATGPAGPTGTTGASGAAGVAGAAGAPGAPGANGTNGTNGAISGIQANGSNQAVEPKLNLISGTNATVACSDNAGVSTNCTISATGGGGSATLPVTLNLIAGNGGGNGADSGIAPASVVTVGGAQTLTAKSIDATEVNSGVLAHAQLPALVAGDIPNIINSNTNGNAATATMLATPPTLCAAGSSTTGIVANGNAQACTPTPHKYNGTAAPASIAGNLAGDLYTDTTNHNEYYCGALNGAAAPACTAVATGGWTLFGAGSGGAGTIASTTNALIGNGAGNAISATGTSTNCVHVDGTSAACPGGGTAQNLGLYSMVSDGGADPTGTTAINTILTSATGSGKTVVFGPGNYKLDNTSPYVTTAFSGRIHFEPGAKITCTTVAVTCWQFSTGSPQIDGLYMTYGTFGLTSTASIELSFSQTTDSSLINSHVEGESGYGVQFSQADRPFVDNLRVNNTMLDGLDFWNCSDVRVSNVYTTLTNGGGVAFVNFTALADKNGGVATNIHVDHANSDGISVIGTSNVAVTNFTSDTTTNGGARCGTDAILGTRVPLNVKFSDGTITAPGTYKPASSVRTNGISGSPWGLWWAMGTTGSCEFHNIKVSGVAGNAGFAGANVPVGVDGIGGESVVLDNITVDTVAGNGIQASSGKLVASASLVKAATGYAYLFTGAGAPAVTTVFAADLKAYNSGSALTGGAAGVGMSFTGNAKVQATSLKLIDDQVTPTSYIVQETTNTTGSVRGVQFQIDHGTGSASTSSVGFEMLPSFSGNLAVQHAGQAVGTQPTLNITDGGGIVSGITSVSGAILYNPSVNTAVILSRATDQGGVDKYAASSSGSATAYTASMSPTLTGYTTGMVLVWAPDVSCTPGALTINIDTLGAKAITQADGASNMSSCPAGTPKLLFYDGTRFRSITN